MKSVIAKVVDDHDVSRKELKASDVKPARIKVGAATVVRSQHMGKYGAVLKVEVAAADRRKLIRETAKQIRAIVETPITSQQRQRATELARKARAAKESSATARFRKEAA
ncbi:hypothetical protein [Herbaspirillum sp. 1130]|uniref:hypothetical protein n=1 Tax=Herbaspirillum sp. 1130 TaxID=2806562 RepID=UPI001AE76593|nr:hypothetical protein [Herbaspirillum sp. 1130]MBP1314371.1 hypothetical protein [Herbaspirillum sp. 1130]